MKALVSYILIIAFFFQILEVTFIVVNFKIHQNYIASVLCINKDKPELQCNGCCHLKKELTKQKERGDQREIAVGPDKPLNFIEHPGNLKWDFHPGMNQIYYPAKERLIVSIFFNKVFHPPKMF